MLFIFSIQLQNKGYEHTFNYKMVQCNDCGDNYRNINAHLRSKNCKEYKDIIFTCKKCGHTTKSLKNIKSHTKNCDATEDILDPRDSYKEEIIRLETERKYMQKKIRQLERNINKNDKIVSELNTVLEIERMKTRIFSHIIDQQTALSVSDLIKEKKDSVHVYEIKNGVLPVYLHKDVEICDYKTDNDDDDDVVYIPLKPNKKREVFRTINCVDLAEEVDHEEIQTKVEHVDEEVKDIVESNFESIDFEQCKKDITECFKKIRTTRIYNKHLNDIRLIRCKMLGWLNIKEYEDLIYKHINKLSDIFKAKKYEQKKIIKIISEGLSPLEMRLTKYGKYYETDIDSEDVERLKVSLEVCTVFPKEYKPYKRGFKRFHNYNLVLFTLKKCIKSYLFNRYGFYNLVYINMPNSTDTDPYSFYYLEKIDGDKRCWKMDCRLEDISTDMSTELLAYCIDLYKKIYRDMFRDNKYRTECEDVYSIAGNEMEQLAENIFILHNQEKCRRLFQQIVKDNAVLVPTDNDKINVRTADAMQKKRFAEYHDEYNPLDIPALLFQDISKNDAQEFVKRFV